MIQHTYPLREIRRSSGFIREERIQSILDQQKRQTGYSSKKRLSKYVTSLHRAISSMVKPTQLRDPISAFGFRSQNSSRAGPSAPCNSISSFNFLAKFVDNILTIELLSGRNKIVLWCPFIVRENNAINYLNT